MYRQTFQKGLFPVFYSAGLDPLKNWNVHRKDGYIKRIYEPDNKMLVMEMRALNSTLHYISCPKLPNKNLAIRMPILNLLIKNLNSCFSFEVRIKDDANISRRFRCANFARKSSVNLYDTTIPLSMRCSDWVLIYFNLADFTRRCYNTNYLETERIQVNGNIHLRRIFFSDKVIEYNDLPKDYKLCVTAKEYPHKEPPAGRPPSPSSFKGRLSKRSSKKSDAGDATDRSSLTKASSVEKVVEVEVSSTALGDAKPTGSKTSLVAKEGSKESIKAAAAAEETAPAEEAPKRVSLNLEPQTQPEEAPAAAAETEAEAAPAVEAAAEPAPANEE